ncbi:zf-HC2 domain-containing protein [Sinomonas halotolerans]|uniref:Zf-HC2 domain-containing protein n=1 Tax=Sinomonas halotolerans TaxID=1644133 RepID=A0ABU9WZ28_9MICC
MKATQITSCAEALRVLAEHLDHELSEQVDAELRAHLDECRSCCSRADFERALRERIRELGDEQVPGEVADRVHRLLAGFAGPPPQ